MDPLFRVREASENGLIPMGMAERIRERFPIVIDGIDRIERASGLNYPVAYVEPSAVVSVSDQNSFQYGIMFARTIPLEMEGRLQIVVQISAPLVAYGLRGTVHAILAHEFIHFLELVYRASRMKMVSDEVSGNIFESIYEDNSRLFEPRAVLKDRVLISHITKRFPSGFRDYKLEDKVIKFWIENRMPTTNISLEENVTRISAKALATIRLDDGLLVILDKIEKHSERLRKRRRY